MSNNIDSLQRFLIENSDVRGELVRLDETWQTILAKHDYPPRVRGLLGEISAATALLGSTLKFDGSLIVQMQGNGPVSLLVVECGSDGAMRATAKWHDVPADGSLGDLVGDGKLVITIDPRRGRERYQGIVAIEGDTIAGALERYLQQSEQLATRLWLATSDTTAAGLLLQRLPAARHGDDADENWNRAVMLADTVTGDELLRLGQHELLYRLFHEEDVRVFDPAPLHFACSCSRERVVRALRIVGYDELQQVLREQGSVSVNCEFCNEHYEFDKVDVEQVFAAAVTTEAAPTQH
jgi:molecular chaperone Hsp33